MRGQVGAEYIFLVSLVFVLVASSVLQSFKDTEINLSLSGARLACQEMASQNPDLNCFVLGYLVDEGTRQVNVTPQLSNAYDASLKQQLKNRTLARWGQTFRPDVSPDYRLDCIRGAYFEHCMVP